MSRYILALDQGTTSSRAILFDRSGDIIQMAQQEFTQHYPQPGWVEHNPNELFDSQSVVASRCLRQAGISASDIAAVGIANQRETTVVWNRKTGAPVYNAIVWQDRRTAGFCDALREQGKAALFAEKTGLVLDAYFSGTKVRWILENVPGAREQAEAGDLLFGTVDSWLIWNFTKGAEHVTDPSNASRTLLFNIRTGDWDDELLELLSVPRSMLPKVVPSSGVMGHMHPEFLGHSLPLAGDAGDQQAATYGNACMRPGMAKNTYGTGCFLLMNTGTEARRSENNLLTTVGWNCGYGLRYALEGSVFIAGAVVQWLRDGLQIIQEASEIEPLAATVPDNGGVFFVPAFAGLGAPYWDQYARGAIVGRRHPWASRPRRHRSHRAPDAGHHGLHEEGLGPAALHAPGGRRGQPEQHADAVSGQRARRARGASRDHRDHGARRGLSRRARRGLLGRRGRGVRPVEARLGEALFTKSSSPRSASAAPPLPDSGLTQKITRRRGLA